MVEATFIGIKNAFGKAFKVQHGGNIFVFEKDEVKVVEAALGAFLLTRVVYVSEEVPGVGRRAFGKKVFSRVSLAEALKLAKEQPENKSIAQAKKEAAKEAEIEDRVLAKLKAAGWAPPKPAPAPAGK